MKTLIDLEGKTLIEFVDPGLGSGRRPTLPKQCHTLLLVFVFWLFSFWVLLATSRSPATQITISFGWIDILFLFCCLLFDVDSVV